MKSPDVNVNRRQLLNNVFFKYDSDKLGFLEASQMRGFIRKMAVTQQAHRQSQLIQCQTKFRQELTEEFIEESLRQFCEIDANGHGKAHLDLIGRLNHCRSIRLSLSTTS